MIGEYGPSFDQIVKYSADLVESYRAPPVDRIFFFAKKELGRAVPQRSHKVVLVAIVRSGGLRVDRAQDAEIQQRGRARVRIDHDVVGLYVAMNQAEVLEELGGGGDFAHERWYAGAFEGDDMLTKGPAEYKFHYEEVMAGGGTPAAVEDLDEMGVMVATEGKLTLYARQLCDLAVASDEVGIKDLESSITLGVLGAKYSRGVAVMDEVLDAPSGDEAAAKFVLEL